MGVKPYNETHLRDDINEAVSNGRKELYTGEGGRWGDQWDVGKTDYCWMSQETVEVGLNTHLAALHLSRKAIASSGGKSTTM